MQNPKVFLINHRTGKRISLTEAGAKNLLDQVRMVKEGWERETGARPKHNEFPVAKTPQVKTENPPIENDAPPINGGEPEKKKRGRPKNK